MITYILNALLSLTLSLQNQGITFCLNAYLIPLVTHLFRHLHRKPIAPWKWLQLCSLVFKTFFVKISDFGQHFQRDHFLSSVFSLHVFLFINSVNVRHFSLGHGKTVSFQKVQLFHQLRWYSVFSVRSGKDSFFSKGSAVSSTPLILGIFREIRRKQLLFKVSSFSYTTNTRHWLSACSD